MIHVAQAGFFSFHWLGAVSTLVMLVGGAFHLGKNTGLYEAAQAGQIVGQVIDSGQKSPDAK